VTQRIAPQLRVDEEVFLLNAETKRAGQPQQLQAAMAQDQTRVVRRRVFDYVAVAGPCCSG
jgi:hypothetical protein